MPPPEKRSSLLPALQGLRGIAALLVLFFHLAIHIDKQTGESELWSLWKFGDSGVQFFFVLSGFIIDHSTRRNDGFSGDAVDYFRRRAVRIYPPYWILMGGLLVLYYISDDFSHKRYQDLSFFLYSLTLLPSQGGQYLGVAWTLTYEIFFYLFYGLVVLDRRLLAPVTMGLAALGLVRLSGIDSQDWPSRFFFNPNMALFAMGIVTSNIFHRFDVSRHSRLLIVCGVVGFATATCFHVGIAKALEVPAYDLSVFAYGLASSLVILGAACVPYQAGMSLGASSYALYITHIPIIATATVAMKILHVELFRNGWLAFVLLGALCVATAVAFHHLIERPATALADRATKAWSKRFLKPQLENP